MEPVGVICLMGATATGKTDLAVQISERFDVELISVDSALVYRDMNIGTAKPDAELLQRAPHHLIDIVDPSEIFSVWDFLEQTAGLIHAIHQRGRLPVLVGGSMMYFHAFEHGLNRLPESDESLRARLNDEIQQQGIETLYARLLQIDPDIASRIKPGDTQRIQRALEVYEITGKPLSRLQQVETSGYSGRINKIILGTENRAELHRRIDQRFRLMLEQGFVKEVEGLKQRTNLHPDLPSMRCVGYRQAWQYLDGELTHDEMVDRAIIATRQLAKRQITWLRKQPAESGFDCLNYVKDDIFRRVEDSFSVL
ncbi:MAG: tRNA (adenosine(37)-N6)-dimethylallyltransferase MiaA [Pseudomonadota bacterium]